MARDTAYVLHIRYNVPSHNILRLLLGHGRTLQVLSERTSSRQANPSFGERKEVERLLCSGSYVGPYSPSVDSLVYANNSSFSFWGPGRSLKHQADDQMPRVPCASRSCLW